LPTEPLKQILDRDMAIVNAKHIIEVASPLLKETVNYATNLLGRCHTEIAPDNYADFAVPHLYLHLIEMTDSIEVLISSSCTNGALPLLRSSFESFLSIQFILEKDYTQRALSWALSYLYDKLKELDQYNMSTKRGREFDNDWDKEMNLVPKYNFSQEYIKSKIIGINKLISEDIFHDLNKERKRLKKELKHWPKWYQLYDGPQDLRKLASALGFTVYYDVLYKYWSSIIHAQDISRFFKNDKNGELYFIRLRDSSEMSLVASLAISLMTGATIKIAEKYRPGEETWKWYLSEIREPAKKLR